MNNSEPFALQELKAAIEKYYRTKHAPGDYVKMLGISSKSLAVLLKKHFNKTLGAMISERIIIEAKRELYLTSKPVKEIAFDLGFHDEGYFSRFFKTNVGCVATVISDDCWLCEGGEVTRESVKRVLFQRKLFFLAPTTSR